MKRSQLKCARDALGMKQWELGAHYRFLPWLVPTLERFPAAIYDRQLGRHLAQPNLGPGFPRLQVPSIFQASLHRGKPPYD